MNKGFLLFTILLSVFAWNIQAQLSIDAENTDYTIDFDATVTGVNNGTFNGSGFAPTPNAGQIDSDGMIVTGFGGGPLNFGGMEEGGDYARGTSTGGVTTGGVYAFDVGALNYAFGVQPAGSDFTPGTIVLKIANNTGVALKQLSVSYDIYVYNDETRGNTFNFAHSADDITYTPETSLDFNSPAAADPSPSWVVTSRNISFTVDIPAAGGVYYLQWNGDDVNGSGSRDEFALDNIVVSGSSSPLPVKYVSFDASGEEIVKLDWKTSMEQDNSHFEVQRSADGKNFTTIGQVQGNLSTSRISSYVFYDKNPLTGRNYYRLKQVDIDGSIDFSVVRLVNNKLSTVGKMSAFPSPTDGNLSVEISDADTGQDIQVIDMMGRVLMTQPVSNDQNQYTLNISDLNSGHYIVRYGKNMTRVVKK